MRQIPFHKFWAPQLLLNTDIVPIEKLKQPENITFLSCDKALHLKEDETVKTGQRLANDLISPYSGKVISIKQINGLNMEKFTAISLEVSSKEELEDGISPVKDFSEIEKNELLSHLGKLGFDFSPEEDTDTAVINILDTDPLSTTNQQSFRENSESLEGCINLLKKATGCSKIIVAITKEVLKLAQKTCGRKAQISIVKPVYPNGIAEILVKKLDLENKGKAKTIVVDMEQLLSMYNALRTGKPAQDKIVTVTAPDLSVAKNVQVKIGTPLSAILSKFNIKTGKNIKVILNGAMQGVACYDLQYPVTSVLNSIYVQKENDIYTFENNPCTNCGKCVAACPVNLQVNLIGRYSEYKIFDECRRLDVESCIECGLCAYSCIAHRPLVHYIHHAKVKITEQKAKELAS